MALESEKTQLLTQNCHLKRLVDQHDNGGSGVVEVIQTVTPSNQSSASNTQHEPKKRKYNAIYAMQTISDSSDEGLGSMSPEPTTVTLLSSNPASTTVVATTTNTSMISKQQQQSNGSVNAKELIDMKTLLEMERRKNAALEDRLRQLTECHPTTIYTNGERRISYEPHEVIEHTDNLRHTDDEQVHTVLVDKVHHNMQNLHVVALDTGKKSSFLFLFVFIAPFRS